MLLRHDPTIQGNHFGFCQRWQTRGKNTAHPERDRCEFETRTCAIIPIICRNKDSAGSGRDPAGSGVEVWRLPPPKISLAATLPPSKPVPAVVPSSGGEGGMILWIVPLQALSAGGIDRSCRAEGRHRTGAPRSPVPVPPGSLTTSPRRSVWRAPNVAARPSLSIRAGGHSRRYAKSPIAQRDERCADVQIRRIRRRIAGPGPMDRIPVISCAMAARRVCAAETTRCRFLIDSAYATIARMRCRLRNVDPENDPSNVESCCPADVIPPGRGDSPQHRHWAWRVAGAGRRRARGAIRGAVPTSSGCAGEQDDAAHHGP